MPLSKQVITELEGLPREELASRYTKLHSAMIARTTHPVQPIEVDPNDEEEMRIIADILDMPEADIIQASFAIVFSPESPVEIGAA